MYYLTKSIHIDMSHQVLGHQGACINVHGHTWEFGVTLMASELTDEGFVVDFKLLKQRLLQPIHGLLDHAHLAPLWFYDKTQAAWEVIGKAALDTRGHVGEACVRVDKEFPFMAQRFPGGMKMAVCDFNPTSERLAQWLAHCADWWAYNETNGRVRCSSAFVVETIHPVESKASAATNAQFTVPPVSDTTLASLLGG